MTTETRSSVAAWKRCGLCIESRFKTPQEFRLHLRNAHCKKEGGSYVCCYGKNNICGSLPLEGVNEQDYEFHVVKQHVLTFTVDETQSESETFVENLRQNYAHILNANPQPNVVMNEWTVFSSSQNLPAVLNDPRRLKREHDLFTKTWGETFVDASCFHCAYLPNISILHFETYIKHVRKGIRRNVKSILQSKSVEKNQRLPFHIDKLEAKCADIDVIPKIFLQSDFDLENTETFNAVIPWQHLFAERTVDIHSKKSSIKLLEEKMSHYLDIAEVHIAQQISMRSEAFFHAMTSHDALMEQLTHVIKSVSDLRSKIHAIEAVLVTEPMKIMLLKKRRKNLCDIYKKLSLVSTVHQTQPTIQKLLNTSDYVGALDMIYTTQDVLAQELSGVHSFRHLGSQLTEMERVIGKMMKTDFIRYVTTHLNRPHSDGLLMQVEKLISIIFGMLRKNQFSFVETYKDECFTTLEAVIKQTMIEEISKADDCDIESNPGNLAEQLRLLCFKSWIESFQLIMTNLKFLLQRIQILYHVMDDTLEIAAGHFSNVTACESTYRVNPLNYLNSEYEVMVFEEDYLKIKPNLKNVLCSSCDHAHDLCAKIFTARAKDGSLSKLVTSEFSILVKCIENFQHQCEEICGKQSTALRLALQSQASRFVSKFHEEKKTKLILILENEQWRQADVPIEFQELVNTIISSGCITFSENRVSNAQKEPQTYLVVNGENFAVCGTVLMLLKMIIEYCQCAEEIPLVAADLASHLVDLLKLFNTKTCTLVLGAEALKLVGLKTITTKHLALTLRCLHLIVYFTPYIKNHFQSKIPVKQQKLDKHFDQITKLYTEHIREISLKIETIISTMFDAQLKKWEVKAPVPSPSFNAISKQLSKVHDLTYKLLPPEEFQKFFNRVNAIFMDKLRLHLARLQVNNDGGPQHGLVTQELIFYTQNLKKLKVPCEFNINDLWQSINRN